MIRVTVELVSAIHSSRNRKLGILNITNNGLGSAAIGHYNC